jgi:uncharacterized membrane protein YqjE
MTDGRRRGEGLLASLRDLIRTLVSVVETRLAILASELEEQGAYFAQVLVFAGICLMAIFFAAALAITFVIAAFWEQRLFTIGILFVAFLALALWSLLSIRQRLSDRPKLLSATLAELEKDKNSLSGRNEKDR